MRLNLLNAVSVAVVSLLSLSAVAVAGAASTRHVPSSAPTTHVQDHAGQAVAVRPWRRIASLSMTGDAALLATCEPDRIICWSAFSTGPDSFRMTGPRVRGLDDLEAIIALRPDLVLVSTYGGEKDRISRLRDAGLTVFELGAMEGLSSLRRDYQQVGALVGHAERGERAISALETRMARIAAHIPPDQRPGAIYVAPIGEVLFGGSIGTSYHDVLNAAGLIDLAATNGVTGWPQYSVEHILTLHPAIIVTKCGSEDALRRIPGFAQLQARIVAVDAALLEDPGPAMLEAAEALHAATFLTTPSLKQ